MSAKAANPTPAPKKVENVNAADVTIEPQSVKDVPDVVVNNLPVPAYKTILDFNPEDGEEENISDAGKEVVRRKAGAAIAKAREYAQLADSFGQDAYEAAAQGVRAFWKLGEQLEEIAQHTNKKLPKWVRQEIGISVGTAHNARKMFASIDQTQLSEFPTKTAALRSIGVIPSRAERKAKAGAEKEAKEPKTVKQLLDGIARALASIPEDAEFGKDEAKAIDKIFEELLDLKAKAGAQIKAAKKKSD